MKSSFYFRWKTLFKIGVLLLLGLVAFYIFKYKNSKDTSNPLFDNYLQFRGEESSLKISSDDAFIYNKGDTLIFVVWFQLLQLPETDQRSIIFLKSEPSKAHNPGVGVSIINKGGQMYPSVYVMDTTGSGGWYQQSKLDIKPRNWNVLVGVISKDKTLGLYGGAVPKSQLRAPSDLLGGYQLEINDDFNAKGDILIGSQLGRLFRGNIGYFGLFAGEDLIEQDSVRALVKKIIKRQDDVETLFSKKTSKIWLNLNNLKSYSVEPADKVRFLDSKVFLPNERQKPK